jgi:hypothetical protein
VAHARRLRFVDAARGSAMLFILVSHFGITFFENHDFRGVLLEKIGLVASPTFMVISGTLVGFLHHTRPDHFHRLRMKLTDRGLFLLTVGRLLMVIGCWPLMRTGRYVLITDAIGLSMIVTPWLVTRISASMRLAVSASLFTISWMAIGFWHPASIAGRITLETLFGSVKPSFYAFTFPLVPWFCIDLAGSSLGDWLGMLFLAGDEAGMTRLLAVLGTGGVAIGAAAKGGYIALERLSRALGLTDDRLIRALRTLTSPHLKWPPSPAYVVFNGGLALCLLSLWLLAERRGWMARTMDYAVAVGRSTLFMFIAQFYVYYTVVYLVHAHVPFAWAWPIYLTVSMLAVILPALEWHRRGYRRFITVGFAWWCERKPVTSPSMPGTLGARAVTE